MLTQLDHKQIVFMSNYSGPNRFVRSLCAQYKRTNAISEYQLKYLTTHMKNLENPQPKLLTKNEELPSMFTLETLEADTNEAKTETPVLSNIEATLNKLAGEVVERTMNEASARLQAMLAQAQKLTASNKVVMHVKLGETKPKELTHEAHELLAPLLVVCNLRHNPVLVGPMGCGKTTFAAQVAEAMGLRFGHIGLTAGASETWLFGRQTPTGFKEAQFSDFYRNGGVFLLDEIDAADSNLLISMNCALANGSMYNPILGEEIERHKDFVCIAAANTFGLGPSAVYTGRNRLDGATLDRFPIFVVDYNYKLEKKLCPNEKLFDKLQKARTKLAERNATQVISTRQFQRVSQYIEAGMAEEMAINTFAAAWPKGLAEEVGLFSKSSKEEGLAF